MGKTVNALVPSTRKSDGQGRISSGYHAKDGRSSHRSCHETVNKCQNDSTALRGLLLAKSAPDESEGLWLW